MDPVTLIELVNQPQPGVDWQVVLSASVAVLPVSATAVLTTTAGGGNEVANLACRDSDGNLLRVDFDPYKAAASAVNAYSWKNSGGTTLSGNGLGHSLTITDFWLPPGTTLGTETVALQPADQWSAIIVTYAIMPPD